MQKGYRILSVEGADIYKAEMENGAAVGVQLPERNSDACFRLFKVFLDNSLDSAALEKTYKRVCRKRFSFSDKYGNAYTLAVVNVKFNYVFKSESGKPVNLKALREHFARAVRAKASACLSTNAFPAPSTSGVSAD